MTTIQVFDPALCCSSGVCGVDVDEKLVAFAADVDWLKSRSVTIERFNLAREPLAFSGQPLVRDLLETLGDGALPVILVGGKVTHHGSYPSRDQLVEWAGIRQPGSIFSEQVAELVAIGAAVASNCERCLELHLGRARELGIATADLRRAVALAEQVKRAPARSIADLAAKHLGADVAHAVSIPIAFGAAPSGSTCCAPKPEPTKATGNKCC